MIYSVATGNAPGNGVVCFGSISINSYETPVREYICTKEKPRIDLSLVLGARHPVCARLRDSSIYSNIRFFKSGASYPIQYVRIP